MELEMKAIRFEKGVFHMPDGSKATWDDIVGGAIASLNLAVATLNALVQEGERDIVEVLSIRAANAIGENTPSRQAFHDILEALRLCPELANQSIRCGCRSCLAKISAAETTREMSAKEAAK